MRDVQRIVGAFLLLVLTALPARAADGEAKPDAAALMRAIVRIDVTTPPDSQSARTLGAERAGTGAVIDGNGLILTIGYLIMEGAQLKVTDSEGRSYPAEFVAYDQISGFGMVRAGFGFKAPPLRLGNAGALKTGDVAVVLSRAGGSTALPVRVVDRREFAGYWEYLLDEAIFTNPPHPAFGGAALVDGTGRLVGIGSLIVGDAVPGQRMAGNMFVPVSALEPIFGDLLAYGRRQDTPRPWLGVNVREEQGRLLVERVTPRSPAESAGVKPGDQIVGVGGQRFSTLADFYRKLWALGPAGVAVPLEVMRGAQVQPVTVTSADRLRHLRLNPTY
ncbi:S1C family serine protease [Azospirillum sp. TSO22-1]|uniref:S1C family serine protease n=1 Tax=Azospirillum sp. TSO22-1 TaxID=716789 RepID=UPI000D643109|nr:S1C family serine protease [Azospirillum sp. TSO22-1]